MRHAVTLGQRGFQFEAGRIRVAAEARDGLRDRRLRRSRHAKRVFVGRKLDDARWIEPILTGEFLDRLAGLVGRDGRHVRRGDKRGIF